MIPFECITVIKNSSRVLYYTFLVFTFLTGFDQTYLRQKLNVFKSNRTGIEHIMYVRFTLDFAFDLCLIPVRFTLDSRSNWLKNVCIMIGIKNEAVQQTKDNTKKYSATIFYNCYTFEWNHLLPSLIKISFEFYEQFKQLCFSDF